MIHTRKNLYIKWETSKKNIKRAKRTYKIQNKQNKLFEIAKSKVTYNKQQNNLKTYNRWIKQFIINKKKK